MCIAGTCPKCSGSSWWGCGAHIPSVLDSVPDSKRCTCTPQVERNGKMYPPMAEKASMLPGWATGVAKHLGMLSDDASKGKEEKKPASLPEENKKPEQVLQVEKEL